VRTALCLQGRRVEEQKGPNAVWRVLERHETHSWGLHPPDSHLLKSPPPLLLPWWFTSNWILERTHSDHRRSCSKKNMPSTWSWSRVEGSHQLATLLTRTVSLEGEDLGRTLFWPHYIFFFSFFFYYSYVHTRLGLFLPPAPTPSLTTHTTPSRSPPQYPAETILPLSLILL
jgi:hypothetical protein